MQSEEELSAAEISFNGKKWFATAFWCQQSIEKALKALFMYKKKESPGTTHSLTFLSREVGIPKEYFSLMRELTKEYYLSRYPDASEDVPYLIYTEDEVAKYLELCKGFMKWVKLQLKK